MTIQLCYTRGTLIPCALKLESEDKNVLDILAEPTAIALSLRRCVKYFCRPSELTKPEEIGWNEFVAEMCTAIWWPSPNIEQASSSRYLEGEIKLSDKLKPTSAMGHFSISVSCPFSYDSCYSCANRGNPSILSASAHSKSHILARMIRSCCQRRSKLPRFMPMVLVLMLIQMVQHIT
jgi:hypothetical protein